MRRICIVTPDIIGPIKNGGIGTFCDAQARLYAREAGCEVSVLFTGPFDHESVATCSARYAAAGVQFHALTEAPELPYWVFGAEWFGQRAERVRRFLAARGYDQVYFQDWQANGFAAIRAKATGVDFADTQLAVTMHSPSAWVRQGMATWSKEPVRDAKLDFMERYCAAHADLVVAPSRYMADWAEARGWRLPRERVVVWPCLAPASAPAPSEGVARTDLGHLVFFGRLETRKGLEIFCAGLDRLLATPDHGVTQVTFLGKEGQAQGGPALPYLEAKAAAWRSQGIRVLLLTDRDQAGALAYLAQSGGVVVVPSTQDNCPYAVIECLLAGVPVLASRRGGMGELVSAAALFDPTPTGLVAALSERGERLPRAERLYCAEAAEGLWLSALRMPTRRLLPAVRAVGTTPRVSVCIAHYNYGAYLPQLLRSLAAVDAPDLEVIVVDDGSTCAASRQEFDKQQVLNAPRGWKFLRKANEGIGATRNRAASEATGDYLIFMDADNVAVPNMVRDFVRAMAVTGADCLTCHFEAFSEEVAPTGPFSPVYGYAPIGPCLEAGCVENVFGDANFCIRREVFERVGGFTVDRDCSFEDWELLAKLALGGYRLDVVPLPLFRYRHTGTGFSRITSQYNNYRRVARSYAGAPGVDVGTMVNELLVPLHQQNLALEEQLRILRPLQAFTERAGFKFFGRLNGVLNRFPRAKRTCIEMGRRGLRQTRDVVGRARVALAGGSGAG